MHICVYVYVYLHVYNYIIVIIIVNNQRILIIAEQLNIDDNHSVVSMSYSIIFNKHFVCFN